MRILIKLVVILAVVAALVYGGLRGYIWYDVKKGVDKTIQQVSPFVSVTYKSIYSSPTLDGTVGIDGIVIKPKMTSDEFKIQSVRLSFPNILYLINAGRDIEKREMPERMKLSVSDLAVDLNSQIFYSLKQMQMQAKALHKGQQRSPLDDFQALGCGDVQSIGLDELTRMGYQTMDVDLEMEYGYKKLTNDLTMSLLMRSKGMYSANIKAAMKMDPNALVQHRATPPTISSMTIDYTDSGFATLRNRFCAAQINASEDVFIVNHIKALSHAVGATFPLETVEAYKRFMAGDSRLSISIAPKPGTDISTLGLYPPKDVIDMLELNMTIDKTAVDFSKMEWGKSYDMPSYNAPPPPTEEPSTTTAPSPMASNPTPARYRSTAPSRLGKFVGSEVKLKTYSGMERDGVIESVSNGTLSLRMVTQRGGGYLSFPIAIDEIASAEVLY
jgi:hypothetical protein